MATLAVVRDNFVYNDTLFAQVDGDKRHTRASVADLTRPCHQAGEGYEEGVYCCRKEDESYRESST
jgi:hypothetical protein